MEHIDTTCPYCGSHITVDRHSKQTTCEHCGAVFEVKVDPSPNRINNTEAANDLSEKEKTASAETVHRLPYNAANSNPQLNKPKKKRRTWLWVLGWLFIFPLPLTILLLRKKDMNPILKYGIIGFVWILYFGIAGSNSSKTDTTSSSASQSIETVATAETETTAKAETEPETTIEETTQPAVLEESTTVPETTVSEETTTQEATTTEAVIEETTAAVETAMPVYYSTNTEDTVRNGNTGVYAYKSRGGTYENYYIIDFDEGYVYYFSEGNGNEDAERVAIESGDLNSGLTITYHDGGDTWSYGLHFNYKDNPNHLILIDNDGFDWDFYPADLEAALKYRNSKNIIDY